MGIYQTAQYDITIQKSNLAVAHDGMLMTASREQHILDQQTIQNQQQLPKPQEQQPSVKNNTPQPPWGNFSLMYSKLCYGKHFLN